MDIYFLQCWFLLLILSATTGLFAASQKGPGSVHAPLLISLAGGIVFGIVAQRARMCFAGSFRDILLIEKIFELATPIFGIFYCNAYL